MSLPLEILKLQNLIVWSNWSIFSLKSSADIDVLVFISSLFTQKKYIHDFSGSNQFVLGLIPDLLFKAKHSLEVKGVGTGFEVAEGSGSLFGE
jgi:hypothetical protein